MNKHEAARKGSMVPCLTCIHDPLSRVHWSGLDLEQHTIIEVACIVTDGDLQTRIEVRS